MTLQFASRQFSWRRGCKDFLFISYIGVDSSQAFDTPFSGFSLAAPNIPYAVLKLEAENQLLTSVSGLGMMLAIARSTYSIC